MYQRGKDQQRSLFVKSLSYPRGGPFSQWRPCSVSADTLYPYSSFVRSVERSLAAIGRVGSRFTRNKRRHARPEPNGGLGVESNGKGYSSEETASDAEEEEEEMGATMDPPVALGPDIMMKILESSDARSVARRTLVSLRWHEIAPSDFLWDQKVWFLFTPKRTPFSCLPTWTQFLNPSLR